MRVHLHTQGYATGQQCARLLFFVADIATMSIHKAPDRKVTTHRLHEMKSRGEKIAMLTAYDYSMARILDGAGLDVLLVGN